LPINFARACCSNSGIYRRAFMDHGITGAHREIGILTPPIAQTLAILIKVEL
jgi:hypothetical protein